MKKKIINNTILFICILAYIFLFRYFFGDSNILIGVMSVTGLLMFMARDLTGQPVKNTFWLVGFYLLIGVASFISSGNVFVAIPINLIVVFIISYKFCHILKEPMYIPFTLLYLFLLAYPVSAKELPLRLIALIIGALSIMAPQMLINKNKIQKASLKIFNGLIELLIAKITCIENKQDYTDLNAKISGSIKTLKFIIYDKSEKNFYISEEGKKYLNILASLEKVNFLLHDSNLDENEKDLGKLKYFLAILKDQLVKYDKKVLDDFIAQLKEEDAQSNDLFSIKFLATAIFTEDSICAMHDHKKLPSKLYRNLKEDVHGLKNIKFNSIKLSYSIRIALEVTVACFIMQFFDLHQGRWIMYTVLSLTTPFFEYTKSKAKDRIVATLIGAIFVAIVFSIFTNPMIRGLIVILAGYSNIYCKTYRQKITSVTISAIGAAVLVGNHIIGNLGHGTAVVLSFERVLLILTGAIIAIVINKFIFHYDVKKANDNLENASEDIIKELINNLDKIVKGPELDDYVTNSYLLVDQLENTVIANKKQYLTSVDEICDATTNRKLLIASTIYELDKFSSSFEIDENDHREISKIINNIKNYTPSDYNLDNFDSLNGKVLASYFMDINKNLV